MWKDDGALDVVSCGQDPATKIIRPLRWATVYLPGMRTIVQQGIRKLILDTRDGPMDLGELSSQPCLRKSQSKARIECALLFGEKKQRRSELVTWSLSLSLGEDAAIAAETLFSPHLQPQPIARTNVDPLQKRPKNTEKKTSFEIFGRQIQHPTAIR